MKTTTFGIALFALLALAGDTAANTITIDFDAAIPGELYGIDYFEDGFAIRLIQNHYDLDDRLGDGYMMIDTYGGDGAVRLDHLGHTFDFLSVEILNAWNCCGDGASSFLTSSRGGYTEITEPGLLSFANPQWTNLSWIQFNIVNTGEYGIQRNFVFDDIQVESVPDSSSTLGLVGLGLVGLGGWRRLTEGVRHRARVRNVRGDVLIRPEFNKPTPAPVIHVRR
jgi:hypothetical protein